MSTDTERTDEYMNDLAERFTAAELCEELDLDVWDIIESFREKIIDNPNLLEKYR